MITVGPLCQFSISPGRVVSMDIKIEPGDELMTVNLPENTYGDEQQNDVWNEGHSTDVKYENCVKEEEIEEGDAKQGVKTDSMYIKQEHEDIQLRNCKDEATDDDSLIKIKISEACSSAEWKPDQCPVTETAISIKEELLDTSETHLSLPKQHKQVAHTIKKKNQIPANKRRPLKAVEKQFKCDQCESKFSDSYNLKRHQLTHSGIKSFKCDQCSLRFALASTLKIHIRSHTGEKPFSCSHCEYKTAYGSHFKTHYMSHTGEKPYKCDKCDFKSARSGVLKTHQMTHSGQKPFKCDICEYKTAYPAHLKTHKMTHTGEKPFECDQCIFKCARSGVLKMHQLSHSGEKPLKCDECHYKTAYPAHLKTHKRLHTGEKPYKCGRCDFRSARSDVLKMHLVTHSGEQSVKCDECV